VSDAAVGLDLRDPQLVDALKHLHHEEAPPEYPSWLDRNLGHYDPIARSWRLRDVMPVGRTQHSYKCADDRCIHYIYGFPHPEDRDHHAKEHAALVKRDSGLSVGGSPSLVFPDPSSQRSHSEFGRHSSPVFLPRPGGSVQLAPLSGPTQHRERDSLRSYSFVNEFPGHQPRRSIDSEVDPLLPPLKRSRVMGGGPQRLESINELRLTQDVGACLRCKVLNKVVREGLPMRSISRSH
jgi:hypothetical protein